jgi:hypothetical protein
MLAKQANVVVTIIVDRAAMTCNGEAHEFTQRSEWKTPVSHHLT